MGTTVDKKNYLMETKEQIRSAIIAKGQLVSETDTFRSYVGKISNIGGGSAAANNIVLRDFDGTVLYSYSLTEIQELTALPAPPTHTGLVFQGWNWSLADIKDLGRAVDVGAMYVTASGKSEFDLSLMSGLEVTMQIYNAVDGGVITVDWGDGTSENAASTTTGEKTFTHTYDETGQYTASVDSTQEYYPYGGMSFGVINTLFSKRPTNICTAIRLGERCTEISSYLLYGCYALKSITIHESITYIGNNAFRDCHALKSITIPPGITSIGANMFQGCYALTSIAIPESVTSIGNYAFSKCYALTNITIPDGVTSIGEYAFSSCHDLTSIAISEGITSIGANTFTNCYALTSMTMLESVTNIEDSEDHIYFALTDIIIIDGVKLGNNAFTNCHALTSVTIPAGITSIGTSAFDGCYALTSINIPDSVTSIGDYAFSNCYSVVKYTLCPPTPPVLSSTNAFHNGNEVFIIEVPQGSLTAYQTATNWSVYTDYMREAT